jgi:hypothetical protein
MHHLCIGYTNILPNFQKDSPITSLVIQILLKIAKCVIYPDSILKQSFIFGRILPKFRENILHVTTICMGYVLWISTHAGVCLLIF